MDNLIFSITIFSIILICGASKYKYVVKHIEVPVDHFSFTNNSTFHLRYLYNDSYWHNDGPVFFYTGNEGDVKVFAENTGIIWEFAPVFGALIIFAEHRYYGESLPFGNVTFSDPEHLGYLTSTQALADFVFLIKHIQDTARLISTTDVDLPVITFGGSYGGMLAAWIRMKYPASVLGAVASSAPIFQFDGLTNCWLYNAITTETFRTSSKHDCTIPIKNSWKTLREVTETDDGKAWFNKQFKLCSPIKTKNDLNTFIDWLEGIYGDVAMVNYPYPTNFLVSLPANPVKVMCNKLNNTSLKGKPLLLAVVNAVSVYVNYTGETKCLDTNVTASTNLGETQWDFQSCTELVMPMCSASNSMFEESKWNFTGYKEVCHKRFGVSASRPDLPIMEYGGKNLDAASNIIFSNGLLDPWSGGGVLHNYSKTIVAVVIPDSAHHLDLRPSNPLDPKSVIEARKLYKRIINCWLKDYYESKSIYYLSDI